MVRQPVGRQDGAGLSAGAAERLARAAASESEAADAVRRVLEEMLV